MRGSGIEYHKGRTQSPCKECDDHNGTCRSNCQKWKDWEEIHAKERAAINRKKFEYNLGFGAPFRTEKDYANIRARETQRKAKVFKQHKK